MNDSPLHRAYATLELQPGCEWHEVRRQYKRLAFAWHPDRHAASEHAAEIEERAKAINAAYDVLAGHYRARRRTGRERSGTQSGPDRPGVREAASAPDDPRTLVARSVGVHVLAAIAASAAVIWVLVRLALAPAWESRPTGMPPPPDPASDVTANDMPPGDQPRDRFDRLRVGADTHEVLRIYGAPRQARDDVWVYDDGRVFFRGGRVSHWFGAESDAGHDALRLAPGDSRVTYGSTRAEVRRILGAPAAEGDSQWTYGPSRIYFEDGRVSGWYNSPLQPLRVEER